MDRMAEAPGSTNGDEEPDEYRVLPPEPVRAKLTVPTYSPLPDEPGTSAPFPACTWIRVTN